MKETDYLTSNQDQYSAWKSMPLFSGLDSDGFGLLLSIARVRSYQSGEVITEQGDFDPWVYILIKGTLSILVDNERVATLDKAGDIFGELVLKEELERSATVVADRDAECIAIDAVLFEEFDKSIKSEFLADFFRVFSKLLAKRLRDAIEEVSLLKKELNHMS